MIVEFFNHSIQEIEFEMRSLTGRIEDCEQFVSIHLDTVRYFHFFSFIPQSTISQNPNSPPKKAKKIPLNLPGHILNILLQESNYENRCVLRVCRSDKWLWNACRRILRDEHDIRTGRNTPCLGCHCPSHHSLHGSHHGLLYEGIFYQLFVISVSLSI